MSNREIENTPQTVLGVIYNGFLPVFFKPVILSTIVWKGLLMG